jgi:transcriptional regulator with XRE-family HTH domain
MYRYRFTDRLAELRTARGWSREMLAALSGLSYNSVYSYETRRRVPAIPALFQLADALGVEVRELVDDGQATEDGAITEVIKPVGAPS